tara:strand:- start:330 stop:521 length:192 start_codon:yes stop_codon:yes gene_type:complete
MKNDYWRVDYNTGKCEERIYISADYAHYDRDRVIKILSEIHPNWCNISPEKVETIPSPNNKKD